MILSQTTSLTPGYTIIHVLQILSGQNDANPHSWGGGNTDS